MRNSRQRQIAGEASTQVQGQVVNVYQGLLSEDRAREIAREEAKSVLVTYSDEASEIGSQRIDAFSDGLVDRLAEDGTLDALRDPAFHVLMRKAQIGASQTDEPADYELLANMVADRARRPEMSRSRKAGLDRAVEVVDKVEQSDLWALTLFHLILVTFSRNLPLPRMIASQAGLYETFIGGHDLPTGRDWIDNLELLDAVRVDGSTAFVPFEDFFSRRFVGSITSGLARDTEDVDALVAKFVAAGIEHPIIFHDLKPDHYRMFYRNTEDLDSALKHLPTEVRTELKDIATNRFGFNDVGAPSLRTPLMDEVRKHPVLRNIELWWNQLGSHFTFTAVGLVLSRAYAEQSQIHREISGWEDLWADA